MKLLKLGEEEGLTTKQAAELLGVAPDSITQELNRHSLNRLTVSGSVLQDMKRLQIVGSRTKEANFLPRDTIRQLVKILNTPEAQQVYDQLWVLADTAYEAHVKSQEEPFNLVISKLLSGIAQIVDRQATQISLIDTKDKDFFIDRQKQRSKASDGRERTQVVFEYLTTVQVAMDDSATLRSHLVSEISL